MRAELELMLTKLSSKAGLNTVELEENKIAVEGKTVKILLESNALKIESNTGRIEIKDILEIRFFKKTGHYLLKLRNGILRIFPEQGDFKFFIKLE